MSTIFEQKAFGPGTWMAWPTCGLRGVEQAVKGYYLFLLAEFAIAASRRALFFFFFSSFFFKKKKPDENPDEKRSETG